MIPCFWLLSLNIQQNEETKLASGHLHLLSLRPPAPLPGASPVSGFSHLGGYSWTPDALWRADASGGCLVSKQREIWDSQGKQVWIQHWGKLCRTCLHPYRSYKPSLDVAQFLSLPSHTFVPWDLLPLSLSNSACKRGSFIGLYSWAWLPACGSLSPKDLHFNISWGKYSLLKKELTIGEEGTLGTGSIFRVSKIFTRITSILLSTYIVAC